MTNCTETIEQEYYGWAGNCIFIIAQMFQIFHTFFILIDCELALVNSCSLNESNKVILEWLIPTIVFLFIA